MTINDMRKRADAYLERSVELYGMGWRTSQDAGGRSFWYHPTHPEDRYYSVAEVEAMMMEGRVLM